jgi:hypothetical protein
LRSLKIVLGEFLSEDLLGKLSAEFSSYGQTGYENFAVLGKVTETALKTCEAYKNRERIAIVVIANSLAAACDECDLYTCSFTGRQNFERFAEYILAKKNA